MTVFLKKYKSFIVYSIIGFSGVAIDFLSFLVLFNYFKLDKNVANIISTTLGITNNFFWNAFLNFKVTDKLLKRFLTFYGVGLIGLGITTIIFWIFVDILKLDANLVKACSIVIVVIAQYNLNKSLSFKK